MAIRTNYFRHVWRTVNDGNRDIKVLALQQWWKAEGWEHDDILKNGGLWKDIEVSRDEIDQAPYDYEDIE